MSATDSVSVNIASYGPSNPRYLRRIRETLDKALNQHPRTLLLRFDLRLPTKDNLVYRDDPGLIKRFMGSLQAQIVADLRSKSRAGKRVHPTNVRYIWCREFDRQQLQPHYHVALMLNKDAYAYPGCYKPTNGEYIHCLAVMIMEAWGRVLNLHAGGDYRPFYPLVEFPENGYYHLETHHPDFNRQYGEAIARVDYLAKEYSKNNDDGLRNFGCSQC
ncbi:inovirus Gp2 family protein [Enterobacter cloacae]|uniref:inovirus Gp2 family protein n=1 Tax=Enterobacter cloacae TaxID=550 RepID=UPI0028FBDBFF|nr:inovirus Gp2 family protein [Enterobacter cloacae]MDT9877383.1 inovirus Gp2 family protein [Enterobacter cloacae]